MQDRVAAAMEAVPREWFLPPGQVAHADEDVPLAIGYGQTCSQPSTVRRMLELLDVRVGDRVLDVGAGSGWTTALLARLTGPGGTVTGVERLPDLVERATADVEAAEVPWARVVAAEPGTLGLPSEGPYDRVLVSAMATALHGELVAQLAAGGVLVVPVAGRLLRVRAAETEPLVEAHGFYRFVPLVLDPPTTARVTGPAGHEVAPP